VDTASEEPTWIPTDVQNSIGERTLAAHLGLKRPRGRAGTDAEDENGNPFELKTTTVRDISTGRDIGPTITANWRKRYWVVARGMRLGQHGSGLQQFRMDGLAVAHPDDLEAEFARIDDLYWSKFDPRKRVLDLARGAGATEGDLADAERWMDRGCRLNNPKIRPHAVPWTVLDHNDPQAARRQLGKFVSDRPLT
jgi:hypothetical protein